MNASDIPLAFAEPFAENAATDYIRTVPVASQIGIINGAASFNDGFPPLTFIQAAAGGYPPDGRDVNYMLYIVTRWLQWQQAGGVPVYNATLQSQVGGYPNGAVVASVSTPGTFWRSTADNNLTDPDAGGANWDVAYSPRAFTSAWVAGSTAFAASTVTIFAHGYSAIDQIRNVVMQLECTSAELGFSVGNRINGFNLGGGGNDAMATAYFDATNVKFTMPSVQVVEVYPATSGASSAVIDITKWRMRFLIN